MANSTKMITKCVDVYHDGLTVREFVDKVKEELGLQSDEEAMKVTIGTVWGESQHVECSFARPETEKDVKERIRKEKQEQVDRLKYQVREFDRLSNIFNGEPVGSVALRIAQLEKELADDN